MNQKLQIAHKYRKVARQANAIAAQLEERAKIEDIEEFYGRDYDEAIAPRHEEVSEDC